MFSQARHARQYSLAEHGQTYRFHLRVHGGSGLLISNGTAIALSLSCVLIVSRLLQGVTRNAILHELETVC